MRSATALSVLLACTSTLVICKPLDLLPRGVEDSHHSHANAERAATNSNHLRVAELVRRGVRFFDDLADEAEDGPLETRSPIVRTVKDLRQRMDSGDIDLHLVARDGVEELRNIARDVDFNALAGERISALQANLEKKDIDQMFARWLVPVISPGKKGLRSRVKRGVVQSMLSSVFSTNTVRTLAKTGATAMLNMARNVDYNALAARGLNALSNYMNNSGGGNGTTGSQPQYGQSKAVNADGQASNQGGGGGLDLGNIFHTVMSMIQSAL